GDRDDCLHDRVRRRPPRLVHGATIVASGPPPPESGALARAAGGDMGARVWGPGLPTNGCELEDVVQSDGLAFLVPPARLAARARVHRDAPLPQRDVDLDQTTGTATRAEHCRLPCADPPRPILGYRPIRQDT